MAIDLWDMKVIGHHYSGMSIIFRSFQWHVQHYHGYLRFLPIIILGLIEFSVADSHTTERFLLLYGKVISFVLVRFEIQGLSVGFEQISVTFP